MAPFSDAERIALAVIRSLAGLFSVVGSSLIIYTILRERVWKVRRRQNSTSAQLLSTESSSSPSPSSTAKKKISVYHRFMLCMSSYDIVHSFWQALGMLVVPRFTKGYGAMGNQASCTAQGFFSTFAISALIYNIGLSIYYVLTVRYGWEERTVARYYEPIVHGLAWTIPLTMAIYGLADDLYNPSTYLPEATACFALPLPSGCRTYPQLTCIRGYHFYEFNYVYFALQCFGGLLIVTMTALLWTTIARQYRQTRHRSLQGTERAAKRNREIGYQAMLFAGSCFYANIWNMIQIVNLELRGVVPLWWFKFTLYNGVFGWPVQGFFNLLVYVRPRYNRMRTRHPHLGRLHAFQAVIFGTESIRHGGSFKHDKGNPKNGHGHGHGLLQLHENQKGQRRSLTQVPPSQGGDLETGTTNMTTAADALASSLPQSLSSSSSLSSSDCQEEESQEENQQEEHEEEREEEQEERNWTPWCNGHQHY